MLGFPNSPVKGRGDLFVLSVSQFQGECFRCKFMWCHLDMPLTLDFLPAALGVPGTRLRSAAVGAGLGCAVRATAGGDAAASMSLVAPLARLCRLPRLTNMHIVLALLYAGISQPGHALLHLAPGPICLHFRQFQATNAQPSFTPAAPNQLSALLWAGRSAGCSHELLITQLQATVSGCGLASLWRFAQAQVTVAGWPAAGFAAGQHLCGRPAHSRVSTAILPLTVHHALLQPSCADALQMAGSQLLC